MSKSGTKSIAFVAAVAVLGAGLITVSCSSTPQTSASSFPSSSREATSRPGAGPVTPYGMFKEVRLIKRYIPKGRYGRKVHRPMRARYITVHSTQNYTGDAWDHARALERGKLRSPKRRGGNRIGYLTWHFTVQEDVVLQHLPTTEQGEHADFDGPGNNYSIGIEMCEHRGNSKTRTLERTAKLCASLMHRYGIPLNNVVPHYHWPRKGKKPANKNCPHYLMTNGRPGRKWSEFKRQVLSEYRRIQEPQRVAMAGEPGEVLASADAQAWE